MDRITQLQDGVEQLQFMFLTSINYLQENASLVQTDPGIPVTQKNEAAEPEEAVNASKKELAKNIVHQVKQNELIIESLSTLNTDEDKQLEDINKSCSLNDEALEELERSISGAEKMSQLLNETLRHIQLDLLSEPF